MTTSNPLASVLASPTLDPDLLPPLEMDGYLTGTLLTPDLEASQWVADLWTRVPSLADEDRLQRALASVLARRKAIEADLQKGWPAFRPSFCEAGKKADHDKVRAWIKGFWKAMRLDPQYWSDLAEDERTATFIGLFVGFIDLREEIDERGDADEIRDEHAAFLPRALVGMRKLALLREGNERALRSIQANKIGRNAPCPCGSGKKFKRCCRAD
jgi:uncharacterized protein